MNLFAFARVGLGFLAMVWAASILSCSGQSDQFYAQATASEQSRSERGEILSQGLTRSFYLYTPSRYNQSALMPLVMAFHGGAGNGERLAELTGLNQIAEQEGFIVVYPDGISRGIGYSWNDGRQTDHPNESIDDVSFVKDLINHLVTIRQIDQSRIYAVGSSNGGFFVQTLACEKSDQFAAFASISATLPQPLESSCKTSQPISLLMIHRTGDRLVPWDGGSVRGRARGEILSALDTFAFWNRNNECLRQPNTTEVRSVPVSVMLHESVDCPLSSQVELYEIRGEGHGWPRTDQDGIDANKLIWGFFEAKRS